MTSVVITYRVETTPPLRLSDPILPEAPMGESGDKSEESRVTPVSRGLTLSLILESVRHHLPGTSGGESQHAYDPGHPVVPCRGLPRSRGSLNPVGLVVLVTLHHVSPPGPWALQHVKVAHPSLLTASVKVRLGDTQVYTLRGRTEVHHLTRIECQERSTLYLPYV